MSADNQLTPRQRDDLRIIAGMIIPASDEYKVPGADDAAIQADILATLGRDTRLVAAALDHLARLAGMPFADLEPAARDARPRRPAMLLPRRPRAALARARAARAVP